MRHNRLKARLNGFAKIGDASLFATLRCRACLKYGSHKAALVMLAATVSVVPLRFGACAC
jgi:hypothetical protein